MTDTPELADALPEPDVYLQIGMEGSPNEGDRIARTYLPKHYDKTWWRFEPLYTQAAIEAAVAEVNALNGALTDKCNSYIIANARLAEQVAEARAVTDAVRAVLVELVRLADTVEKANNPTWDAAWNAARTALQGEPHDQA